MSMASADRIANPALFICDIQEKFRTAIYEFPKVVTTTQKLVKTCKILNIPIYTTTQNAARLGATVPEITDLLPPTAVTHDKTAFSMLTPELLASIQQQEQSQRSASAWSPGLLTAIIVGIETHVCITQTAIDLLSQGHKVYIVADGVSSCNKDERPIALARLAREGATVTTSESLMFELLGDAKNEKFKEVSGLVKESKEDTRVAVETFCRL